MANLKETSTSRILNHLKGDQWAIISPYRSERTEKENRELMNQLKAKIRSFGLGFNEFVSRWVEEGESFDERSLLIPDLPAKIAMELGQALDQSSVIVKDEKGCREVCTTPFESYIPGETVRTYNTEGRDFMNIEDAKDIFAKRKGGPASMPVKGNTPFHLSEMYEIEEPRPSYFQTKESWTKIYGED